MIEIPNLILVGPMGAGKSTVGRRLAHALELPFFDSDREIEQRTGASIPLIFELEAEAGFRARERNMIEELTGRPQFVLATGGGAILDPDNRRRMADTGQVVYLHATVDQQLSRTARDHNRPLLQTENPRARLESLLELRDPLYREIAALVVETDRRSVPSVVQEILRRLGLRAVNPSRRRARRGGRASSHEGP